MVGFVEEINSAEDFEKVMDGLTVSIEDIDFFNGDYAECVMYDENLWLSAKRRDRVYNCLCKCTKLSNGPTQALKDLKSRYGCVYYMMLFIGGNAIHAKKIAVIFDVVSVEGGFALLGKSRLLGLGYNQDLWVLIDKHGLRFSSVLDESSVYNSINDLKSDLEASEVYMENALQKESLKYDYSKERSLWRDENASISSEVLNDKSLFMATGDYNIYVESVKDYGKKVFSLNHCEKLDTDSYVKMFLWSVNTMLRYKVSLVYLSIIPVKMFEGNTVFYAVVSREVNKKASSDLVKFHPYVSEVNSMWNMKEKGMNLIQMGTLKECRKVLNDLIPVLDNFNGMEKSIHLPVNFKKYRGIRLSKSWYLDSLADEESKCNINLSIYKEGGFKKSYTVYYNKFIGQLVNTRSDETLPTGVLAAVNFLKSIKALDSCFKRLIYSYRVSVVNKNFTDYDVDNANSIEAYSQPEVEHLAKTMLPLRCGQVYLIERYNDRGIVNMSGLYSKNWKLLKNLPDRLGSRVLEEISA